MGLKSLKLLENSLLFILDRRWQGFPTKFLYSSNLHKMPPYVIPHLSYLICSCLTPWEDGSHSWATADFCLSTEQPADTSIFKDFQGLLTSLLATRHLTAEVVMNWFNVGFLALTFTTFYANAFPLEDLFFSIPSKKIHWMMKDENEALKLNTKDFLTKDDA